MPFDIKAAQDAGYSLKEIISHLSDTVDTFKQQQQPAPQQDTANIFNVQNNSPSLPTLGQLRPTSPVMRTPPPPQSMANPPPGPAMGPPKPVEDTLAVQVLKSMNTHQGVNGASIPNPSTSENIAWEQAKRGVGEGVSVPAAKYTPMTDSMHQNTVAGSQIVAVQPDTGKKVYPAGSQTPEALIQAKLLPDTLAKAIPVQAEVTKPKPVTSEPGQQPAPQPVIKPPQTIKEAANLNGQALQTIVEKATTSNPQKGTLKTPQIEEQIKAFASNPTTPPKASAIATAMIPDIQAWNNLPFPVVQQRLEAFPIQQQALSSKNKDQQLEAQTQASVMQLIHNQIDSGVSSSANPEIRDQWKALKDFNKVLAAQSPINVPNIITNQPLEIPVSQMRLSNEPNQVLADMYQRAYQAQQQKLPENPRMVMGAMSPQQPPTPYPTSGQQTLAGPGGTSQASQAPVGSNERAIADAKQTYDDWMANNQLINELKQRGQALTLGNINLPIRRRKLK